MMRGSGSDRLALAVLAGACLAVLLSAFEVRWPLLSLGPVSLTTSEAAAALFFATAALWAVRDRTDFFSRRALDLAVGFFLLSNYASVLSAEDRASAVKFALRMTFAALLFVAVSRLPRTRPSHVVVAGAVAVTALLVTAIGLAENFIPVVDWPYLLSPWQEVINTFGTFYNIRVASTLPFPTVLSMYLELAFPVALVFGLWLRGRRTGGTVAEAPLAAGGEARSAGGASRWVGVALLAGTMAIMAVQVYTFTRSALVATPLSLLMAAAASLYFRLGRRVPLYFFFAAAMLMLFLGVSLMFGNRMATRLGVAEQQRGYSAHYQLLSLPEAVAAGKEHAARVRITNDSDVVWHMEGSDKVVFSYRWLDYPEKSEAVFTYLLTYLPRDIKPGETFETDVTFAAPDKPRRYVLVMELIKTGVGWFSSAGVTPLVAPLDLSAPAPQAFAIAEPPDAFVSAKPVEISPGRRQLWTAALRVWRDRPLLGAGPGQFRKIYPQYMPGIKADERLETHNILLEAAANTGSVGVAAMVFLLASAAWHQLLLVAGRTLPSSVRLVALGLLGALAAYAAHGMLDFFLWQNGVTFLFFIELGLTAWLVRNRELASLPDDYRRRDR